MRLLLLALCLSLLLLQGRLWISGEGIREVRQLTVEVAERTGENRTLAARNAALEAEVQDLKQGLAAVEERARVDLGMTGAGETFFQITPQPAASTQP